MHPAVGEPTVIDGTASPATTTISSVMIVNRRGRATFSRETQVFNQAASGNLIVNGVTVPPGTKFTITGIHTSFTVLASTGTVAWTALAAAA